MTIDLRKSGKGPAAYTTLTALSHQLFNKKNKTILELDRIRWLWCR